VNAGELLSDRRILEQGGPGQVIGMSTINKRRLEELHVSCHPSTKVGDYAPFYFCPRSIMLYVIYKANHAELTYRGGQAPIVHLEADLHEAIRWAEEQQRRWAFSLSNAGAYYTEFRSQTAQLDQLNWEAIEARDFRAPDVKEGKQAEFLMYVGFPLDLVERVGVHSEAVAASVLRAFGSRTREPVVEVRPEWYF
jgi:hypothetical protein